MQDDSTVYLQFNFAKFRPLPNLPATAPKFTLYVEVNYFFYTNRCFSLFYLPKQDYKTGVVLKKNPNNQNSTQNPCRSMQISKTELYNYWKKAFLHQASASRTISSLFDVLITTRQDVPQKINSLAKTSEVNTQNRSCSRVRRASQF